MKCTTIWLSAISMSALLQSISRGFWVMCSLPCSSSRTQHQSSCSSSFSSVSQDGCIQTVPGEQRISQFNEPLTSPQSHDARHPVFLSELTGEPWPAFWSSETLVVKEPIRSWDPSLSWSEQSTYRRRRGHVTAIKLNRWFKTGGVQLVEPSVVFPGHWSRTSEEEQWTSSRWGSDCSSPPTQTQTIPIMTWTLSSIE